MFSANVRGRGLSKARLRASGAKLSRVPEECLAAWHSAAKDLRTTDIHEDLVAIAHSYRTLAIMEALMYERKSHSSPQANGDFVQWHQ